jgi:hypothetical protein
VFSKSKLFLFADDITLSFTHDSIEFLVESFIISAITFLIDNKLIFNIQTIDLCKKFSLKIRTLSMCAFLFDAEFKEILYFPYMIIVQLFSFILLTKQTVTC